MPEYRYEVSIPVRLSTQTLEGDSRRVSSYVERMVERALQQIARIGGAGGPSSPGYPPRNGGVSRAADEHVKQFKAMEREASRSAKEVQRINAETARQAEAQARIQARADKTLADARIREARRAADGMLRSMKDLERGSEQVARSSSSVFDKYLGAAFFGALAARAFKAFYDKARQFLDESVRLSSETQNAFTSAAARASQFGLSDQDTRRTINNLNLVKLGMVSASDAAVAYRNLLSRFTPEQTITLMNRFADSLAFGKREAISYGEALKAGTQGLKNLESATVDNLGFGKNLSTIMKEQKLKLEDLDSAANKQKATMALYNGILKETAVDTGNAQKWSESYTGALAQQEVAERNLQIAVGDYITNSPRHVEAIKIVTEQISGYTEATRDADSETARFVKNTLDGWASIKAQALPFAAYLINMVRLVGHSLALVLDAVAIGVAASVDVVLNTINNLVNRIIDALGAIHNGIRAFVESLPVAGTALASMMPRQYTPGDTFKQDYNATKTFVDGFNRRLDTIQKTLGTLRSLEQEGNRIRARLDASDGAPRPPLVASSFRDRAGEGAAGAGGEAGKKARAAKVIIDESEKWSISELRQIQDFFRSATGRELPVRAGQSGHHNRMGWDHRNAADVRLHPDSPEGRLLLQYLNERDIPHSAWRGATRNARGQLIATGPHIHVGEPSRAFGRNVRSRAITRRDDGVTEAFDGQLYHFTPEMRYALQSRFAPSPGGPASVETSGGVLGADRIVRRVGPDEAYRQNLLSPFVGSEGSLAALELRRRNADAEAESARWESYVEWQNKALDVTRDLARVEEDLRQMRAQNADDQMTEQRRLLRARGEELELEQRLQDLQDEAATAHVNQGLRVRVALQEELNALRREELEAIESQARSQVRLADQTVYHAEQANARVLDFLASQRSVTDVIADAKIAVIQGTFDLIDRGLDSMTRKLGLVGGVLKDLLSGFIRLALNRAFASMMLGGGGGGFGATGGGFGAAGAGLLGSLGQIFTRGAGGGGGVFAGGGILGPGILNFGAEGGAATPDSLSGGGGAIGSSASALVARALANGGGGASSGLGGLFSGLGASFAPALPLLGLTGGAVLGGQSGLGRVLGGAGGLLLGGMGLAALAPGVLAGIFGGASAGGIGAAAAGALGGSAAGGFGGLGAIAGLFSNPITAVVGGALLVGAVLLSRNARERRDERTRDQVSNDTGTAIWQLIDRARFGDLSVSEARAEFDQIRQRYFQGIQGLQGRARRHAELQWTNDFAPLWNTLERVARDSEQRANDRLRMSPVFAEGGAVSPFLEASMQMRRFAGRVPGAYDRADDRLIRVSGDETVITPAQRARLGGSRAMAAAGVPGYQSGGDAGDGGTASVGAGGGRGVWKPELRAEVSIDADGLATVIIDSPLFDKAVVQKVKVARKKRQI